jgi:Ca2+-binding EF-hand superfamily protein
MRPLLVLISSLLAAAAAQAGGADCQRRGIADLDANSDGAVSRDEASSHAWLAGRFDGIDANKDGQLDKDELSAKREAHHAERKARTDERWKASDTDGNGSLSLAEATASSSWVGERFTKLDANSDGELTREEMGAARRHGHAQMREHTVERFKAADTNGDGAIDLAEAQTGLPMLAEKFSTVDADNDGKVTPAELKSLHHRR